MKVKNFVVSAAIIGGLTFGGFQFMQAKADEPTKPTTTIESKDVSATIKDVAEFKSSSMNEYFSYFAGKFNGSTIQGDVDHVKSAGFNESYAYYLEAMALENSVVNVQTENAEMKKDLHNLYELSRIIQEEGLKHHGKDQRPPTERMTQAIKYTAELLTDLSIITGGTGEYYGVSNVGGGNAKPIEDFINDGE